MSSEKDQIESSVASDGSPSAGSDAGVSVLDPNPAIPYNCIVGEPLPGLPGLVWQDESILESGRTGFYLVYSPKTHQVLFTHLDGPYDRSVLRTGDRDTGYRLLGPLPKPPTYLCPGTLNGITVDPKWSWE